VIAVMFLLGVVIGGAPAVNPDMWWSDILATSAGGRRKGANQGLNGVWLEGCLWH